MYPTAVGSGHCGGMGLIPGPVQWVKGAGIATAVAQILAWKLPHASAVAIKKKKKNNLEWKFTTVTARKDTLWEHVTDLS